MTQLVDSHCHLDFPELSTDIPKIIDNAASHDVSIMQTICTRISDFPKIRSIAEQYNNIYCSVGIHPHNVKDETTTAEELVELAQHQKVIGIGETGLDYFYEHSPRELQQQSFREHIEAARKTKLPLIVHTRDADEDMVTMLTEEHKKGVFPGLIHCFSSTNKVSNAALELGLYISISGIITFKKAEELRDVVKDIPLNRLLVETDAPYLAPAPHRGKTNEPAFTKHTAEYLAKLKNISYEELAATTTQNFFDLFTKVKQT